MPKVPSRPPAPLRHALRLAVAAGVIALALAGCAALDTKQREWIFQPTDRTWSGGLDAAKGMQEVWIDFDSRDSGQPAHLHGLWLPQASAAKAPLLLYLHGARWDVRGSAHRMRRMHELGFAVLGVDYRGFGQSTPGLPSESMALEDARAAWDWLAAQHPGSRRYLFGHSLGSAIAVRLASEVSAQDGVGVKLAALGNDAIALAMGQASFTGLSGLIVEGSFTSIPDVISRHRWGWLPVGPLITQRFDAAHYIGKVRAPVLVVHGSADQLIHPELGRALYDLAPQPKRFVLVDGGSHHNTNTLGQPQYREALAALFGLEAPR